MRDPNLPILDQDQHYEFEIAVGPDQEHAVNVRVSFDDFPTLGHLIQTLHSLQSTNATQLAAAYILAENDEEYQALFAVDTPEVPDDEDAIRVLRQLNELDPFYENEVVDDNGQLTLDHIPEQRSTEENA